MKQILAATLLSVLLAGAYYQAQTENSNDFQRWSQQYGKTYTDEERLYRETVYNQNKRMIEEHNNDDTRTYRMGENQFMALTRDEFIGLYLNQVEMPLIEQANEMVSDQILQAVDWRNATTVKAQGSCASGWAFSVSNNLEAWYKIRAAQNISVATQQLVDCDQYSNGCNGGVNYYAMFYIQNYKVANSSSYPYVAYKQTCKTTAGVYGINNYTFVGGYQSTLQSYLQNYPVSVGVDASNWQFYSSGLFYNCSSNLTNHYALAVGFDSYNNWIIQNSFGTGWGESGVIRLYSNNTCGILNQAYQVY